LRHRRATQQIEAASDQGMKLFRGFLIYLKGVGEGCLFLYWFFQVELHGILLMFGILKALRMGLNFLQKGGGVEFVCF